MKLKITNPYIGADYGVWELNELIMALVSPLEYDNAGIASAMRYDLSGNELEFEIAENDTGKTNKPIT